jgi:hypothetical protein
MNDMWQFKLSMVVIKNLNLCKPQGNCCELTTTKAWFIFWLHSLYLPLCRRRRSAATVTNNTNFIAIILGQATIDFQNCNF